MCCCNRHYLFLGGLLRDVCQASQSRGIPAAAKNALGSKSCNEPCGVFESVICHIGRKCPVLHRLRWFTRTLGFYVFSQGPCFVKAVDQNAPAGKYGAIQNVL